MPEVLSHPNVLTLEEASDYLRLPEQTTRRLAIQGGLPCRQVDGEFRFLKMALDDWLRGQDGRAALLAQVGALADDDSLPALRDLIYAQRGRPEVENGVTS